MPGHHPTGERHRTGARTLRLTTVLAAVVTWTAALAVGTATADVTTDTPQHPFVAEVTRIDPAVDGLSVSIDDDGRTVVLENATGSTVVVRGLAGEEFLRVTPEQVEENTASLTRNLAQRDAAAGAPTPALGQDPTTPPEWSTLADGTTARWVDLRTQWASDDLPPNVVADPTDTHEVFLWVIELTVDDRPVLVHGVLTWTGESSGSRLLMAGVVALTVPLLLVAAVVVRRLRGRRDRHDDPSPLADDPAAQPLVPSGPPPA